MAINRVYEFSTPSEMQIFLNGGLIGGEVVKGIVGLVGQTITFTSPTSATVTFARGSDTTRDQDTLLFSDIKAQVEAAVTGLLVTQWHGRIVFIEASPSQGVATSGANETGKMLLGLDGNSVNQGYFHRPPGVSGTGPQWTWMYSMNEARHVVYTWR